MKSSPCYFADQLHLCVQIDVSYNDINQAASLELIAAMKGKSMVSIGMAGCKLGVKGAKAMAELVSVTASVTSVNVLSNQLDVDSADLLLKVKAEKPNLRTLCGLTHEETELNLWNRSLGPGDAKLLAAEILVMASLTKQWWWAQPLLGTSMVRDLVYHFSTPSLTSVR